MGWWIVIGAVAVYLHNILFGRHIMTADVGIEMMLVIVLVIAAYISGEAAGGDTRRND